MAVKDDPRRTLAWLKLRLVPLEGRVVLFGSTVMALHGMGRECGDIDVFVRPRVYALLRDGIAWTEERPHPDHPPFLSWHAPGLLPVNLFYDWRSDEQAINPAECFLNQEMVCGWPCITLPILLKHKEMALKYVRQQHHEERQVEGTRWEKHVHDVAAIRSYMYVKDFVAAEQALREGAA